MKEVIDGNTAAAWGARLSRIKVFPNFPITPQTEIIEVMAEWKAKKEWNGEWVNLESEHSVLSAAISSEATGARTFTASSSQGLMLMSEMHYVASGMRLPLVMANCSRGLAAPITLWSDHNDIMALKNTGWLIFMAKNNQEVVDSIIQAYKISENRNVLLPSIVNLDGFILSFTNEPTEIPNQKKVDKFLPPYEPKTILDVNNPMSLGVPSMENYMYFKSQIHKAQLNAKKVITEVGKDYGKHFGREYGLIEKYRTSDAKVVFVGAGAMCTTIEAAVDSLRKQKIKAGLLRLRTIRPFPKEEIEKEIGDCEHIAVMENSLSPGLGGTITPDLCTVLDRKRVSTFITGLGGRHIGRKDFEEAAKKTLKEKKDFWIF